MYMYRMRKRRERQATGRPGQQQGTPYFSVVEIPKKTVTGYTTYPASIEGIVNSEVRAKVSGYITDVLVDEGQKVRKGQTFSSSRPNRSTKMQLRPRRT